MNFELKTILDDEEWFENLDQYISWVSDHTLSALVSEFVRSDQADLIAEDVVIEDGVVIDGLVKICTGCVIKSGSRIEGPVFIDSDSVIGPNSYIHHGVYIGKNSRIKQGFEIKSSILLEKTKCYHYGFVGNSIIGRNVNVGAGFVSALRRFDQSSIEIRLPTKSYRLDHKTGCFVGDDCQIGVNVHVLPGRIIPPGSNVLPGSQVNNSEKGDDKNELDQEEEVWKGLLTVWDKEADRFWMRNNVFLAMNGGILVFLTSFSSDAVIGGIVSVFGLLLCAIWHNVNIIGKYYLDRWKIPLKRIEQSWHIQPISGIDESSLTDNVPKTYKSSSRYMIWLIKTFCVLWLLFFIYNFSKFVASLSLWRFCSYAFFELC